MSNSSKSNSNGVAQELRAYKAAQREPSLRFLRNAWPGLPRHVQQSIVLLVNAVQCEPLPPHFREAIVLLIDVATDSINGAQQHPVLGRGQDKIDAQSDVDPAQVLGWHYAACRRCTAKWFSRSAPSCCPRCGDHHLFVGYALPPWIETFK